MDEGGDVSRETGAECWADLEPSEEAAPLRFAFEVDGRAKVSGLRLGSESSSI